MTKLKLVTLGFKAKGFKVKGFKAKAAIACLATTLLFVGVNTSSFAAELEEIVVTAQKRSPVYSRC